MKLMSLPQFARTSLLTFTAAAIAACTGAPDDTSSSIEASNSLQVSSSVAMSSSSQAASSLPPVIASSSSVAPVPSSSSVASSASSDANVNMPLVIAINAGSTTNATFNGVEYIADKYAQGGSTNQTTDAIMNANGSSVMQTERWGDYSYDIPVLEGTYTVEMHFVEMYHQDSGLRSFNIAIENEQIENNLDLFATTGHDALHTITAKNIRVTDGKLTLSLSANIDAGTITGFAIYSSDGGIDTSAPVSNCTGYIALTFDDGPTGNTRGFIQSIRDNNLAPVTFFVWASRVSDPSVIPEMLTVGEAQNHSYSHPQGMGSMSYQQAYNELSQANDVLVGAGAPQPTLFRVPYLEWGNGLQQAADALGLYVLRNQIDTQDWNGATTQQIINTVANASAGSIILAHETEANTRAAIPGIARVMQERGLCSGRIDPSNGRVVAP